MIRRHPNFNHNVTLLPTTTLFRSRDHAHRDLTVIDMAYGLDDVNELHRHHMHDHRVASRPLAASRATVDPAIVLFPARRPGSSFSPRRPATHVEKPPYHSLLPERKRGAEPTRVDNPESEDRKSVV